MKAFVTGGAGFIGSHLVDRLLEEGYEVTAYDNLTEGRIENLAHLKNDRRFKFIKGDMRDAKLLMKEVKGHDVVFHMAAQANIRKSLEDHYGDLQNNLLGHLNLLEAMLKNEVSDLVFASTSALYGEAEIRPTPETYAPIQTSLYGASKLACEAYTEAYTQFSDINFWAYRFSNVVGERCRRGVIWDFVHKLWKNSKELEILGNGKQSKEYIYVKDCVEGMIIGYKKAKKRVNIFNLAVEDNKTVDEVADIVIREMNLKEVKRVYTGGERGWIGDNPIVHLDISRLKSLGWRPRFSAEEAITTTARWTIESLKNNKN
ncbi:MAG: SDR family NAD(P)-dependent oxidoreductase [Conexivisphaerales archaeon]